MGANPQLINRSYNRYPQHQSFKNTAFKHAMRWLNLQLGRRILFPWWEGGMVNIPLCSICVPQALPHSFTLYPISFAQNTTLVTYIPRAKRKAWKYFILGVSIGWVDLLGDGQINEAITPSKNTHTHARTHIGWPPHN